MKNRKQQEHKKEVVENLKQVLSDYIMTLTEKAMIVTGLSASYCRNLVIRQLARQKGISLSELDAQKSQSGEVVIAGTLTAER